MEFGITITADAELQLGSLSAREQKIVGAAILARLQHQPTQESRAIKKLRPNPLVEYELRVGEFRVLYNVDVADREVVLVVIGRKVGNKLVVGGEEFHGHLDDPLKPAEDGPASPS